MIDDIITDTCFHSMCRCLFNKIEIVNPLHLWQEPCRVRASRDSLGLEGPQAFLRLILIGLVFYSYEDVCVLSIKWFSHRILKSQFCPAIVWYEEVSDFTIQPVSLSIAFLHEVIEFRGFPGSRFGCIFTASPKSSLTQFPGSSQFKPEPRKLN